jgi:hypothetical protein
VLFTLLNYLGNIYAEFEGDCLESKA